MKKYIFAAIAFCLGSYIQARGENTDISTMENVLYIEPIIVDLSETHEALLSVKMKNSVTAEGFGFDLYLPEGFDFALDEDGFPEAYLSTARTTAKKTNNFDSAIQKTGALRVFAYSSNGSAISGNDGEVACVKIKISEELEDGTYPIILRKISISDSDAVSHDTEEVETSITTTEDPDGINSLRINQSDVPVYNLHGIQVVKPTKGIYIREGLKVVVK